MLSCFALPPGIRIHVGHGHWIWDFTSGSSHSTSETLLRLLVSCRTFRAEIASPSHDQFNVNSFAPRQYCRL